MFTRARLPWFPLLFYRRCLDDNFLQTSTAIDILAVTQGRAVRYLFLGRSKFRRENPAGSLPAFLAIYPREQLSKPSSFRSSQPSGHKP